MIEYVIGGAVGLILGALIGVPAGIKYRVRIAEQEMGSAEQEAARIVSEAIRTAEGKKKEALVEANLRNNSILHQLHLLPQAPLPQIQVLF